MVNMTKQEYNRLLSHYDSSNEEQRKQFEKITYRYPYFQSAYAHYLKSLKKQEQYNYQLILRKTAILSPDRSALMNWLNTELKNTKTSEGSLKESIKQVIVPVNDNKIITPKESIPTKKEEKVIQEQQKVNQAKEPTKTKGVHKNKIDEVSSTKKVNAIENLIAKEEKTKDKLSMSFTDWITYSAQNKIENEAKSPNLDEKISLIDTFLKNQPKIPPVKQDQPKIDLSRQNEFNKEELMTETLAKVYLQQKKFKKALYAYKILSLKYPEKNSFFADQIKKIKKLQQNS